MATAVSPQLSRALRGGRVTTTTTPKTGPVMRAPEESADTSALDGLAGMSLDGEPDDDLASLMGMGSTSEPAGTGGRAPQASLAPAESEQVDREVSERRDELPSVPLSAPPASRVSRSERFAAGAGVVAAEVVRAGAGDETGPAASARPWRRFVDESSRVDVVSAKRNMAAAKVLTPLVAAVSFSPGSSGSSAERAKALSKMLLAVHQTAVNTAQSISGALNEDVPAWMVTQLMQSVAGVVAQRWQRKSGVDVDALIEGLDQLVADAAKGESFARLIVDASEDAYVEVNSPDVARHRIGVSATNAAWTIYDWVTNERLSLDPVGDQPSRFYTYGLDVSDIVNRILVRCVDECRALAVPIDSADMRTAHLQSAIGRMANLMGAEYVTQTRQVMNWISDEAITDAEFEIRSRSASEQLETRILPHIYEWARSNFLRIEQGAFRAIEDLNEQAKNPMPTDGNGDRPAGH